MSGSGISEGAMDTWKRAVEDVFGTADLGGEDLIGVGVCVRVCVHAKYRLFAHVASIIAIGVDIKQSPMPGG